MPARHLAMASALGLSLMLTRSRAARRIVQIWEYPRSLNASGFVITAMAEGQPVATTMVVAASAIGACAAIGQPSRPDVYCASVGCFPPGQYRFTVQAQVGDQLSGPSNIAGCQVDAQCQCTPIPASGGAVDLIAAAGRNTPGTTPAPTAGALTETTTTIQVPAPITSSAPQAPVFAAVPTAPSAPAAGPP